MSSPRCGAPANAQASVGAALRRFLPGFAARHPASPHAIQVLRRLARCHTGDAGWSLWQCACCQSAHWRPLGCGDRHCPDCQGQRREQWLESQREALLPVRYYHWVFTLPALLRPLALQNQALLYGRLFAAAARSLLQFGHERLGVELGVTALLHTWGQNLVDHPHLHCLVTGGGLRTHADGSATWVGPSQSRYLFHVKAVAAMFAGKFIDELQSLRRSGELRFEGALASWADDRVWSATIAQLRSRKWIVFAKGSVVGPEAVLEYLGRYTHRVAIANGRILSVTDSEVSFRYKDYRQDGAIRTMTLPGEEFVHRLSLHVLPRGFTKIRHYGILGNNRRKRTVPIARAALARSRWHLALALHAALPRPVREEPQCPRCGAAELLCVGRLDAADRFTPLAIGARRLRIRTGDPPATRDTS
jgi:hypothetical protein